MATTSLFIRTVRLDLVAARLEHLAAELANLQQLGQLLGAEILASWPPGEFDRFAITYFHDRLACDGESAAPWYAWYAIRRATADVPATLIASGGYFGPPSNDGTVEIGYSVVPEWRRHGYATEMVGGLLSRLADTPGINRVLAECDVQNVASIGVLTRCGFRRIGKGHEPHFDRFQLDRAGFLVGQSESAPVSV